MEPLLGSELGITSGFILWCFSVEFPPKDLCCIEVAIFTYTALGVRISYRPNISVKMRPLPLTLLLFESLPPFKQGKSAYCDPLDCPILRVVFIVLMKNVFNFLGSNVRKELIFIFLGGKMI